MAPVLVDLSKIDYYSLLRRHVPGNGHFMGMRHQRGGGQRGAGLGGILGVALSLLPKLINSSAGQQLVSVGKDLTAELAQGKDFKSSLKSVAAQKMRQLTGAGKRRRGGGGASKRIKGNSVTVLKPHFVSKSSRRTNFLSP
ncbi:hypothetical protein GCK72_026255 [Caenorhabditis remanei]|uniref:Uncharacterized protein n=1 Tax=Caenorhabditis remanei TaxID=31234 RepID=A0A6A5G4C5_CAERE|nr:hypothetical protein GCK72_025323 [Caenorhabditis remanei]XP_053580342.1 hypothetical protein GCK72_026255 [Caenorhabditis remanei]KAF1748856.1 hypothetical protein GCK72_025323 [Caenorhabditis remanei]KAF1749786.1 hypothetical protein GCK72_026255 [Caenorhabditis remanei]